MADLNIGAASTTSLTAAVTDFSVSAKRIDGQQGQDETFYDFPNSAQYLGYYKTIPELKKAIDSLAIWTAGLGLVTDIRTSVILEHITGWGEDSFQSIMENLIVQKKVFGDAFAEVIWEDDKEGVPVIVNIKPLYPGDMRVVVNKKGIIIRYEQRTQGINGTPEVFDPNDILHLSNDRIANEIHGTSVIEACKWVIDARNEAMNDERKIKHRELALGVLYVDTDNAAKISSIATTYGNAIKNGEMLVLPKDVAEIKDTGIVQHQDRLGWIQYLENFFYQSVGIPKVICNSSDYTEAASKVGFLTFEPVYTREQTLLESDLWNQLLIRIKFNRPPSLSGMMQESEQKNDQQTSFQPSEFSASAKKTE